MAVIVIGGHTRNIGKTSVVCSLIAAMPQARWTAIKITQFGHGVCSANGKPCDCETADHTLAVTEERDRTSPTDTSRYLAAGAARSLWVRTRQGQLAEAMPRIRKELEQSENVLIESNSVLRFLQPDLYAAVLDAHVQDFKVSSLRYLDRSDALLLVSGSSTPSPWKQVSGRLLEKIPQYRMSNPGYYSEDFHALVAAKLRKSRK